MAALVALLVVPQDGHAQSPSCGIGFVSTYHVARCDASGGLIPWNIDAAGPFDSILGLQARWWLNAPNVDGWPTYVTAAQLDRNYSAYDGAVPASTISMAIEAQLKYYAYTGDAGYMGMAITMGDYVVQRALTPETYAAYPLFPWAAGSTGNTSPDGSGHPNNTAGQVMPDKGAMVGIALLHLYEATENAVYRDAAIHIANVLADNALPGGPTQSPWPFRVEADSGAFVQGPIMGNQVFALRLYDELIHLGIVGNGNYQATRDNVWGWLKNVAIADGTGDQWNHFFEDVGYTDYNPTQFNALEMARYLLEKKEALDPEWFQMAGSLIDLVKRRWVVHTGDYTGIAEQTADPTPYISHTARYASILSKYYEAGGPPAYKDEAYGSFAYSTYGVDFDGFAATQFGYDLAWTTDSFGDWLHHFMDGIAAVPEWAPANSDHLLRTSSVVQAVTYGSNALAYVTYDSAGQEKLKLTFIPTEVRVNGTPISTWTWDSLNHVLVVDRVSGNQVEVIGSGPAPGFALSAGPASQTVAAGDSVTYTVGVDALNGFSGSVSLSVVGLPAGATATLLPALVTGSGSSTLTVSTSTAIPPGSYTLTVLGVSGNSTQGASVTLTIPGTSSSVVVVTFDDVVFTYGAFTGQYPTGLVDWGSDGTWFGSGPWGLFNTQSVSFTSEGTSASFTLLPTNVGLVSLQAFNGGSDPSVVTISCPGEPSVEAIVPPEEVATIDTWWTTPCSTVTLATTNGWYTNFDNLVIATQSSNPDFTFSAAPAYQTVTQGAAATYTIHVAGLNGFSGAVSFDVTGLPTGATATFAPASLTGSGSSTLSVFSNATTPPGSYALTVTGSSDSATRSRSVTLAVNPASGFAFSATPNQQTVSPGDATVYAVKVTGSNGFSDTVSFDVAGLPTGATAVFTPAAVIGSGSTELSVSTSAATPPGSYALTITGSSSNETYSRSVTLAVTDASDFVLSATPDQQNVVPGGAASYTIGVTGLNGFAGTVGLSVAGLPGGAAAAFNPASVTAWGSSTFIVSTSASTPAGSYALTVTGSGGGMTHTTSLTVVVLPAANFFLSATPGQQSIAPGGAADYAISVNGLNGFIGTVSLSVAGLPPNATATFLPASVNGSGPSTLTVSTSANTPTGSYPLTIIGVSDNLTQSAHVTLTVPGAASSVVVTFDDAAFTYGILTGQYPSGVIDWGSGGTWYGSGPWGLFTTQSVSFAPNDTSASFTLQSPDSGLVSLQAYNGGPDPAIVTIACSGQWEVYAVVPAEDVATIDTGWTTPCATVTLTTTNGWYTNFDDLAIASQSSAGSVSFAEAGLALTPIPSLPR